MSDYGCDAATAARLLGSGRVLATLTFPVLAAPGSTAQITGSVVGCYFPPLFLFPSLML